MFIVHSMWSHLKVMVTATKMIHSILEDIKAVKLIIVGDNINLISIINTVEKVWLDIEN